MKTRTITIGQSIVTHIGSDAAYKRMCDHQKEVIPKATKQEKAPPRKYNTPMEMTPELLSSAHNLYLRCKAKRLKHNDLIRSYVLDLKISQYQARRVHKAMKEEFKIK